MTTQRSKRRGNAPAKIRGRLSPFTIVLAFAVACTNVCVGQNSPESAGAPSEPTVTHFPGDDWMQYADIAQAGFSRGRLERARKFWEKRDSSAFLVVSGGAVVVSWGDVERRFLCHSVRKSLLSALYGVYSTEIDLERTLADLGIDDEPPLTELEKQARIVDLISSRSGVYHPATGEPPEMSSGRPLRGSHPPGEHWWYNNWDFNVAGVAFEQETGRRIFEAFDEVIAKPIRMEDYRISDGFYHLEPEKSIHPAYPLRMSTRDLARFGLLFAREGRWEDQQIIPREWVEESTQPHSEVDLGAKYGSGYGYMWWIEDGGGYTARGWAGHVLAVYPEHDLVMVIRADTYRDRSVSTRAVRRLFDLVLEAGGGERAEAPRLVRVAASERKVSPERNERSAFALSAEELARYTGELEMDSGRKVTVTASGSALSLDYGFGTFLLRPENATRFIAEDSEEPILFELGEEGRLRNLWIEPLCYLEAAAASRRGSPDEAVAWVRKAVEKFPESARAHSNLALALYRTGRPEEALEQILTTLRIDPEHRAARQLHRVLQLRRFGWILGLVVVFSSLLGVGLVRRRRASRARTSRP